MIESKSSIRLVLGAKYRMVNNALQHIRAHLWLHLAIGLGVVFALIGGGTAFFYMLFRFLMHQEVFGPPLMDRLVAIVMLAFFSMLIFSNLIITLTTTYISREISFLLTLPLTFRQVFGVKLAESIVLSSWAFAILSFPLYMAFGMAREVAPAFYVLAAFLMLPFLIIPGALGATLTMVLSAVFPARKTRTMSLALGAVMVVGTVLLARLIAMHSGLARGDTTNFNEVMGLLNLGAVPVLPNFWVAQGMIAAGWGDLGGYLYWLLMLWSTALMSLLVCYWLAPVLYYRGWCLTKETSSKKTISRPGAVERLIRALPLMSGPMKTFVAKDIKVFWRDPAQWSQLLILFGLLLFYLSQLRAASRFSWGINILFPKYQVALSFINLGATCFVLSILTTRFFYPMLSLEGKQYWIVGLAPLDRTAVVREKWGLSWASALAFTLPLMLVSAYVLSVDRFMLGLSLATVLLMSVALTSLAVGLGALFPDFREDNPARIANGLGGTLNVVLSLIYIGAVIAMLAWPVFLYYTNQQARFAQWRRWAVPYGLLFAALNVIAAVVPMRLGLRAWRRMEF
ncbi:MAG: hypothetical protein Kow0059_13770 [Candidatus Sumerlaeia bacterium]